MAETVDLLVGLPFQAPRKSLLLFGWSISDDYDEQCTAALMISLCVGFAFLAMYIMLTLSICDRRARTGTLNDVATDEARLSRLWTIHNKRYDLREFVWSHPGGAEAIYLGQGRNCTEMVEAYHSLANEKLVRSVLARYYVEDTPSNARDYEKRYDWESTPFYDEVKRRVRAYFHERNDGVGHRATLVHWAQLVIMTIATFIALYGFMRGQFVPMLLLPFFYWLGPSPFMHDAGHFTLSRYPIVHSIVGRLGMFHISLFQWQHWHNIGHHSHPNVPNKDPDLYHFAVGADKGFPGFRSSLELRTLPEKTFAGVARQSWWWRGVYIRMPLATVTPSLLWDAMGFASPNLNYSFMGIVPYKNVPKWRLVGHSFGRAFVIWLAFIHPVSISFVIASGWLSGLVRALLFALVPFGVHGCVFYVFTQFSHIQEACFKYKLDEVDKDKWHHDHPHDGVLRLQLAVHRGKRRSHPSAVTSGPVGDRNGGQAALGSDDASTTASSDEDANLEEWAVHQAEHAFDYSVDSHFWLHVSNGLNLQIVHHLFPQVAWSHYPALTPIIKEVCEQFGVSYSCAPTFWDAARLHFKYLEEINAGPHASTWIRPENKHVTETQLALLDQTDALWDFHSNRPMKEHR